MTETIFARISKLLPSRAPRPDHPMADTDEAKMHLQELEGADPRAAVADMANWFRSFNVHDGFTPGRRARVLLVIGDTIRPFWRILAHDYLAPDDEPIENRPGDQRLLKLMHAANDAETAAWGCCFVEGAPESRWLEQNLPLVLIRWMRALVLGATLGRMLQLPPAGGIWVMLKFAYRRAQLAKAEGRPVAAHSDEQRRGSVRQEFIRGALIELASPDGLKAREIELMFRIAGRFAASVQLVGTESPDYIYAVDPESDSGPVSLRRVSERKPGLLYFDLTNCIAQMQPFYESGRSGVATAPDARFGSVFTVREGNAMLRHALACWGSHPPQRKSNRIPLDGGARVAHGLERAQSLCPLYDQGGFSAEAGGGAGGSKGAGASQAMRIEFDDKKVAENLTTSKVAREVPAKLLDASTTGLGLALTPADARWAKVGALVCIHAEEARDWVVGIIRRARATELALVVGVEIVCHRPQVAWLRVVAGEHELVWQDAMTEERNFDTHFMRAILLSDPPMQAGATGEMLVPINRVKPGVGLELPLPEQMARLRVREAVNSPDDYARVRVEWVESQALPEADADTAAKTDAAPDPREGPAPAPEPDPNEIKIDIPPLELE